MESESPRQGVAMNDSPEGLLTFLGHYVHKGRMRTLDIPARNGKETEEIIASIRATAHLYGVAAATAPVLCSNCVHSFEVSAGDTGEINETLINHKIETKENIRIADGRGVSARQPFSVEALLHRLEGIEGVAESEGFESVAAFIAAVSHFRSQRRLEAEKAHNDACQHLLVCHLPHGRSISVVGQVSGRPKIVTEDL